MKPTSLIPTLQSDLLAREIEQQLRDEAGALIAAAERDARAVVAQARSAARRRLHEANQDLRREGARRLARANARLETEARARAQRQAAQALGAALPLLREMLEARWRDPEQRRQWTDGVARLCATRLRPGAWLVEHPADWNESEKQYFTATIGKGGSVVVTFKADDGLAAGLRVKADQAVLDATPQGLLADGRTIAALLLDEIGRV